MASGEAPAELPADAAAMPPADGSMQEVPAEVSTLVIHGFPLDSSERERRNYCKFLAGWEGARCTKSSVFVKFTSRAEADAAVQAVNFMPFDASLGPEPLRAEIAKRDMEVRADQPAASSPVVAKITAPPDYGGKGYGAMPHGGGRGAPMPAAPMVSVRPSYAAHHGGYAPPPPAPYAPPPAAYAPPTAPPFKRARTDPGGAVSTLAILGMAAKGLSEDQLRPYFQDFPGFEKMNVTMQGQSCFVKFIDPAHLQQALEHTKAQGVHCEPARRDLT